MIKHEDETSLEQEALRPRRGFLVAAAIAAVGAIVAYSFQDTIVTQSAGQETAFAFLIGMLILLAMVLLLCYRVPRIGNRLLGYDVVLRNDAPREKSSMQYTGSFQVQTGLSEKRMNTRRKQARHSRRHYAEVTRQMQATEKTEADAAADAAEKDDKKGD